MRYFKALSRFIAILLIICIVTPAPVQAATGLTGEGDPVVDNTYLEVTVKKDGKGFGIYTKEGHPLKKTDNNKPLLYSGDDGFATSYTTIRIKHPDGSIKDYIYGNSYGFMGINSRFIEAPRAGSTSSSYYITSVWEVEKVAIRQTIELSTNAANGEAGYTVIRYEYTNNSGEDLEIGVRIMLDTQIADNDGGYFFVESNLDAVSVEKVYSGDNVPSSFRVQDKVTIPSTIAYGSVSGDNIRKPDAVQVGHWFSLANTLWDFTPNTSINFTNPYNPYKYADSVLDVKIIQAGDGKELIEKIDESTGFKYFKSVDQNLQLAYTIINPDENDPKLSSFETEIYIDDMLFDKKIENNKTAGYKGYAYFSLSDGEHYVRIVSKNGYGDKTVYSTKIAVDGTPPELKLDKPKVGELIDVNSDGSFEVTRPVTDKTKLEYDVRIKVVDNSGNVTEAVVKVNNAKMQNMKAIKLKHTKSQGSSAVEIYAVALDGNGNEMFRIPKETLNWQLYGDEDGSIYFDRRHQENVILIPGDDEEDYAVMASWEIREDFSLTDVLMKSDITDDSPEPGEEPGSKGGSGKGKTGVIVDDSIYRDVIAAFRNEMSAKADIWAASVYPRINNNLNRQGFKVSIPMESLTQSDYLVFARDPDTSMYESTLEQGMKFVSDIVQFQLLKHDNALPGQYTVTIPYDASKVTNTMKLSVYAYNDQLGKWIRVIDSTVNPLTRSVTFTSQYYGRFAVIEDSRNAGFQDVNIDMWSASRINALTLAGIINGYYGKDGLLYYAPKRDITRGEFIKLLVASTGEELDSNADLSVFADAGSVPDWVLPYTRKAVEKGWVKGRAANGKRYLDVNSPITREEAFTLIYRALINEAPGNIERAGFVDMDSVSDYAVDAINYLASVNIVSGDGSRRVLPKKNITREETAKILYECIRLLAYKKR